MVSGPGTLSENKLITLWQNFTTHRALRYRCNFLSHMLYNEISQQTFLTVYIVGGCNWLRNSYHKLSHSTLPCLQALRCIRQRAALLLQNKHILYVKPVPWRWYNPRWWCRGSVIVNYVRHWAVNRLITELSSQMVRRNVQRFLEHQIWAQQLYRRLNIFLPGD